MTVVRSFTRRRAALFAGALVAGLGLAACGGGGEQSEPTQDGGQGTSGPTVVVGSADFSESRLLALIYHGALKGDGVDVAEPRLGIGAREAYLRGMSDGSIDVVPEYTGALAHFYDPNFSATGPDEVYDGLKSTLPGNLTLLDKSAAENKDSLVVTQETAAANNLGTIDDLAKVSPNLTLGAPPEFETRAQGVKGLQQQYGVTFKDVRGLTEQALVQALQSNQVQVANIFTTNPAISQNNFRMLEDTKGLFGSQNVVPLVTKQVATPQVTESLNDVSQRLTTDGLRAMLMQVDMQNQDPQKVADDFLAANGLD